MPEFVNSSSPQAPITQPLPTQISDAERRRDAANALPTEDSIERNDREEQLNDPHYKQWIKDESTGIEEPDTLTPEEQASLNHDLDVLHRGDDEEELTPEEEAAVSHDVEVIRAIEAEQDSASEHIATDPEMDATLAAARQQLRKDQDTAQKQADEESLEQDDEDRAADGLDQDNEPIAVRLTEEQARLILSSEYPNDGRKQTTALAAIYNGQEEVNVMNESVQLDYSEDEQTFFAILDAGEKPALDAKLTQLQQDQQRQRTDQQEKTEEPRQRERSRERQHER